MIVLGQKLYLHVSGRMVASEQQTTGNALVLLVICRLDL